MNRILFLAVAMTVTGCAGGLSQPFANMKAQPVSAYHLQNFDPTPPPGSPPGALPMPVPPQVQSWLGGAAGMLPPGLLPPGLVPGAPAAQPGAENAQRFYSFRIIRTASVADNATRDEIVDIFGHESNFQTPRQSCFYAEFGFSIGQGPPPGAPPGTPSSTPPGDVLVSLSCEQVQIHNYAWPYGTKTGLTPDASKRIIAVVRKVFGG